MPRLLRTHALPVAVLAVVIATDLSLPGGHSVLSLSVIAPLVAGTLVRRRATAVYAALALTTAVLLGLHDHQFSTSPGAQSIRVAGVAIGGVLAVFAATIRLRQDRRLAAATRAAAEARDAVALVTRLQHGLLTDPPPVAGLDMAVRYLPAVRRAQVGGDWYDAFPLPDGDTMLVIGDVAGHDVAAAATMAEARGVLRGIAQSRDLGPAEVLRCLDAALGRLGDDTLITAVVATVGHRPEGMLLRWSNAGHPPPALLHADDGACLLEKVPEPLLGLGVGHRQEHEVVLHAGDTLLLYTDGLVERRGTPIDEGFAWLAGTLPGFAGRPLAELCDALLHDTSERREDDVAVLAVRVTADVSASTAAAAP